MISYLKEDIFQYRNNLDKQMEKLLLLEEEDCVNVALYMDEEVLERAFEPFFSTKARGEGSGMGLPMVYGFAKQSGGQVRIESHVGRGTSLRLLLPAAPANGGMTGSGGPALAAGKAEGGETVLLVEDEPQLRRFVSSQLAALGYDVLEAEAGAPALQILKSNPNIDLLFTDLIMPGGMNGLDLVRHARTVTPHLKVLLTTGHAPETDQHIADIRAPILKKPYKKQQLAGALRRALAA